MPAHSLDSRSFSARRVCRDCSTLALLAHSLTPHLGDALATVAPPEPLQAPCRLRSQSLRLCGEAVLKSGVRVLQVGVGVGAYAALFTELRRSTSRSRELEFEFARRDSRRASAPCQSEA